jgi:DNA-nicking Smr family endonuclease
MKRAADIEDLRLWAVITSTVRPLRPSLPPPGMEDGAAGEVGKSDASPKSVKPVPRPKHPRPVAAAPRPALPVKGREGPAPVEPGFHRRLERGREALAARIDLHGMTQDAARAALAGFIRRSVDDGWRAVLVITGKGVSGDGVLRRRVPDWLAEAPIRDHVAGVSEAHRRHGGEGALYVALKRKR